MSEPTPEAYKAAARACNINEYGKEYGGIWGYLRPEVRAAVDAVWPLAVAEGRNEGLGALVERIRPTCMPGDVMEAFAGVLVRSQNGDTVVAYSLAPEHDPYDAGVAEGRRLAAADRYLAELDRVRERLDKIDPAAPRENT